jgi:hypothetical protein
MLSWESGILKCAKFVPLLLLVVLAGCGGGSSSSSSNTTQTSKIKTRVLVSNSFVSGSTGGLQIVDYEKNQQTAFQMGCCSTWTRMLLSSDKSRTYAVESPPNTPGIGIFDNANEKELGFMPVSAAVSGFTASTDNKFVYTAVRNGASGGAQPGSIEFADTTAATLTLQTVPVPFATNVVVTHNGAKLLAFSDPAAADVTANTVSLVDPVAKTATPITGFDRPIAALFSTDDTTAYVINCGAECGGTQASVSVLDMTPATPVITSTVTVPAATVATLDNGTLYVAGPTASGGQLTLLTVSGATLTPSGAPISIGDGTHQVLKIGNGKAFVGARLCSSGCLSIVDLNSKAVVVDTPKGDVTGADVIPNHNTFYVAEGGELRIYDTTTSKESTTTLIDVVGKVEDILVIDK